MPWLVREPAHDNLKGISLGASRAQHTYQATCTASALTFYGEGWLHELHEYTLTQRMA